MFILYAKIVLSLLLAVVLPIVFWQRGRIEQQLARPNVPWLGLFWLVLRLIPFLIIYVWLGFEPQSDVKGYYYPIGQAALAGKLMYRDVICPYSPFFGYVIAPFLTLWDDARMVVLAMTLVELLAVWLTFHEPLTVGNRPENRPARLLRCLIYYLLPVPFVFCITSGQEDVGLWIFALLAGRAVVQQQAFRAGVWFALGLLSTKALFVLLGLPLFFLLKNKVRFVAACLALGVPVALFFYWKTGLLFIQQPLEEGTYLKAPNLRSIMAPLVGEGINRLQKIESYLGLLSTVALTGYVLYRRQRTAHPPTDLRLTLALCYILMFSWTTVVQHNAISNYAYLFMLPLLFVMVDLTNWRAVVALVLFNVGAAIHPTLWWRIGQPSFYQFGQLNSLDYRLDYVTQVGLVIGFALFAARAAQRILRPAHAL